MSRKKANKYVSGEFAAGITLLADQLGGKKVLADSLGVVYDSVRRWCNGENIPDGRQLLAIQEKFGVSIDWLLTGRGPMKVPAESVDTATNQDQCDSLDLLPENIKNACRQVRDIMLSDDEYLKPALASLLAAFKNTIKKEQRQEERIRELESRIRGLERINDSKLSTGTDGAASSSTGKKKT